MKRNSKSFKALISNAHKAADLRRKSWTEESNEQYWEAVMPLTQLNEKVVLDQALYWCKSKKAFERELGSNVIQQLGHHTDDEGQLVRPFGHKTLPMLQSMLSDSDQDVLASVIIGLSFHDVADAGTIAHFAEHEYEEIRHSVAFALPSFANCEDPEHVAILLKLLTDSDDDVRNWAAFGFRQLFADSAEIRAALVKAASDPMADVRAEAICALVNRKHPDAGALVITELEREQVFDSIYEAVEALDDGTLLPYLIAHAEVYDVEEEMSELIEYFSAETEDPQS